MAMHEHPSNLIRLGYYSAAFRNVQSYALPFLCILAFFAVFIHVIVLNRMPLRVPSCAILTGLALCDGLIYVLYIPFVSFINVPHKFTLDHFARDRQAMAFSYIILNAVAISNWLRVLLTIYMYAVLCQFFTAIRKLSINKVKMAILGVYVTVSILSIPSYISASVPRSLNIHTLSVWTIAVHTDLDNNTPSMILNLWIQSVIFQILPAIFLMVATFQIVKTMRKAEDIMDRLILSHKDVAIKDKLRNDIRRSQAICKRLLIILLFYSAATIPNGLLMLLGAINLSLFVTYNNLGDFFMTIVLVSNVVSYCVYCQMSKRFNQTFRRVFSCDHRRRPRKRTLVR